MILHTKRSPRGAIPPGRTVKRTPMAFAVVALLGAQAAYTADQQQVAQGPAQAPQQQMPQQAQKQQQQQSTPPQRAASSVPQEQQFAGGQPPEGDPKSFEVDQKFGRKLDPSAINVPSGYKIEVFAKGLNYPTDITFTKDGEAYISEAGGHF
jgi:glucose/arabinose dehydrogenase